MTQSSPGHQLYHCHYDYIIVILLLLYFIIIPSLLLYYYFIIIIFSFLFYYSIIITITDVFSHVTLADLDLAVETRLDFIPSAGLLC